MVSHPPFAPHAPAERPGLICCRQLTFQPVGADAPSLQDISLRRDAGGRVGIIGPSGSGKTTLALLLASLHPVALPGGITGGSASLFFAFATPN